MKNIERKRTPLDTVSRRLHIKILLARCHAVIETAKQDMLRFMMFVPLLETALLRCNKIVSGQLWSWRSKFPKHLDFGFANHMSLLLILICLGCFFALLFERGIF